MDRYIKFTVGTPWEGTEQNVYKVYSSDTSDEFLNEKLELYIRNNADRYVYLASSWGEEFENEEEENNYYVGCWGNWEDMTKKDFEEECYNT